MLFDGNRLRNRYFDGDGLLAEWFACWVDGGVFAEFGAGRSVG